MANFYVDIQKIRSDLCFYEHRKLPHVLVAVTTSQP